MSAAFALDAKLESDTVPVGDLPLSRVLLNNDANFPWLILVPRRAGLVELIDLDENERLALMAEIARAASALKSATKCDKLNIAALGNVVAQLHVHIIVRRKDDVAWPKPVWGVKPALAYDPAARGRLIDAIRHGLQIPQV